MIAVNGNQLWQDVYRDTDGYLFVKDEDGTKAFIGKQKVYYSPEELQERIEAAVKEHEHRIGKVEEANNEVLEDNYELERELRESKKRIAELEAERQPVEIDEKAKIGIEWYQQEFPDHWEEAYIRQIYRPDSGSIEYEGALLYGPKTRVDIIKSGYTVKPDPLRSTISAIWQDYEEGYISQTEALDKITEVAKAHARTQSSTEAEA